MRKKKVIINIVAIVFILFVISLFCKTDKNYVFTDNGVTYAINVNGTKTTSFPSKGTYKVTTDCVGATGKWDYLRWKLYLEDITGPVSCNLSFDTISKNYLSDYIINELSGTTQGTGSVVHETFNIGAFSSATALTQSQYSSSSIYSATSATATSGTAVSAFTYSGNEWVSNTDNLTSGTYYHLKFNIPSAGYYQICYEISSGSINNYLFFYQGTTSEGNVRANASTTTTDCRNLGSLAANTQYRIVFRPYTAIASVKFSIKRTDSAETIDTGYRYEGKNPNNYIWFNDEMWRIIGVMNASSHGITNTNLVKIVRNEAIGALRYSSSSSSWESSYINYLLNPNGSSTNGTYGAYYYKQLHSGSYCYGNSSITNICDYRHIGIDNFYRPMVKSVTWHLGGLSTNNYDYTYYITNVNNYYLYERSSTVYGTNPSTFDGYIGLIYPSDYGYATVASTSCTRAVSLTSYSTNACAGSNWLYSANNILTISPISSIANNVTYINVTGVTASGATTNPLTVKPTLYLDSSVYVLDGDGSASNPYIIAM